VLQVGIVRMLALKSNSEVKTDPKKLGANDED
jgi:hypothetical protein